MSNSNQAWTEEIKAQDSLFSVNLKEVWHYRDLLMMLVKRDYVTFYKQTILGPIWFFVQPILTTLMYVLLFGQIAKISTDGTPQLAFYLSGITIWNYFSESLTKTSTVFRDNAAVMGKVYFPRLIMPLSIVVSGLMKFGIQFGLFVVVVLYYTFIQQSIQPNIWVLATPFLLLIMALFSLGLGMIFSSLTTKYKDLVFLLTFGIQLLMYATPVVYPVTAIPEHYRWVVNLNPLTGVFECFRYAFLGSGSFDPTSLWVSIISTILLMVVGVVIFNKVEKSFMDTV
ncbi:ABC transporter permease [Flavobacterium branchiophilum]|uniref:Transport permease protein n=1 Tax=Flavobacterium branchiophilum TaxID=55197 RepID=A0A543G589_9FLAO|nr:ABC transporter permease [Flavobacterium branchiophilum]OXA78076.1 ABC transporter permease [Flavobacterium branchiophilum] [Flavobacterium branchiophilum NBRC 15030 = ATCC 35035]TQM41242.1 lipopolysaccharide transport system permease protein [Flavobacterium branchiophilum]GEM54400.1 transport permease protein [Flavobacterium branchiophilum NBRC 15030 = ATCC 35035]